MPVAKYKDARQSATEKYILSTMPVLYIPGTKNWQGVAKTFLSSDGCGHICTATGASWTHDGISFDGVDDNVTLTNALPLRVTSNFSYMQWVKFNSVAIAQELFFGGGPAFSAGFHVRLDDAPARIYVDVSNAGGNTTGTGNNQTWVIEKWYCIGFTYDSKNAGMSFFHYGRPDGVTASTRVMDAYSGTDYIGISNLSTNDLSAVIGDTIVWNKTLSPVTMYDLFLKTRWRY